MCSRAVWGRILSGLRMCLHEGCVEKCTFLFLEHQISTNCADGIVQYRMHLVVLIIWFANKQLYWIKSIKKTNKRTWFMNIIFLRNDHRHVSVTFCHLQGCEKKNTSIILTCPNYSAVQNVMFWLKFRLSRKTAMRQKNLKVKNCCLDCDSVELCNWKVDVVSYDPDWWPMG